MMKIKADENKKTTTTAICGTDLHILNGDVPAVTDGRILGHEGVGIIDEIGINVLGFKKENLIHICTVRNICLMQGHFSFRYFDPSAGSGTTSSVQVSYPMSLRQGVL
jgi:NADPH:quinone reductase-like Zn-dependent oxidoreductase